MPSDRFNTYAVMQDNNDLGAAQAGSNHKVVSGRNQGKSHLQSDASPSAQSALNRGRLINLSGRNMNR